jgi:hypothetical protein
MNGSNKENLDRFGDDEDEDDDEAISKKFYLFYKFAKKILILFWFCKIIEILSLFSNFYFIDGKLSLAKVYMNIIFKKTRKTKRTGR